MKTMAQVRKPYRRRIDCYVNSTGEAREILANIDRDIDVQSRLKLGRFSFAYAVKLELTLTPKDYFEGQVQKVNEFVYRLHRDLNSSGRMAELDPDIGFFDVISYGIHWIGDRFSNFKGVRPNA